MWLAHEGTVGMPINCKVHIVGDDGEELPHGRDRHGVLRGRSGVRVPQRPREDRRLAPPTGWTTLGDVGYLDADGYLYLTDRKAYMIITRRREHLSAGGRERARHPPEVVDVAVFGVPNDDFGEEVKAVVQPAEMPDDAEAAELARGELIGFCRSQLADVKCPRSIDFRPELPRHPTGKLYKRLLKDEYWKAAGRTI